jgi:hypothetical protein
MWGMDMGTQVPPQHPLRQLFGTLTEKSFTEHLGWPDPNVTGYVTNLLVEFTHTDQLYKIARSSIDGSRTRRTSTHRRLYPLHGRTLSGIPSPPQDSGIDLPQGFPRGLYEDGKAFVWDRRADG